MDGDGGRGIVALALSTAYLVVGNLVSIALGLPTTSVNMATCLVDGWTLHCTYLYMYLRSSAYTTSLFFKTQPNPEP